MVEISNLNLLFLMFNCYFFGVLIGVLIGIIIKTIINAIKVKNDTIS